MSKIIGETPEQARDREDSRWEQFCQAHRTGEFVGEFRDYPHPDPLPCLPKCLARKNGEIVIREAKI